MLMQEWEPFITGGRYEMRQGVAFHGLGLYNPLTYIDIYAMVNIYTEDD